MSPDHRALRAAVIGHPVAHSLSPALHRAAYEQLGLLFEYSAVDVRPASLADFMAQLDPKVDPSWLGLSVTMPHKHAVRPFLAGESELAQRVGAVNTVLVRDDGLHGDNTDVPGMISALREAGLRRLDAAVILGGGATGASALAAVAGLGCREPVVLVRDLARTADLVDAAERLALKPHIEVLSGRLAGALGELRDRSRTAVISTLPPGAADSLAATVAERAAGPSGPVLLDVAYGPTPTALTQRWQGLGGRASDGFTMLLHQAVEQVELMTGQRPDVAVMRRAGQAEIRARR